MRRILSPHRHGDLPTPMLMQLQPKDALRLIRSGAVAAMTVRVQDSGGVASGGVDTFHRNLTVVCGPGDMRTSVLCTTAECQTARQQLLRTVDLFDGESSRPSAALAVMQIRPALGATVGLYRVLITTSGAALFCFAHSAVVVYLGALPCANVTIETNSTLSCIAPAGTGQSIARTLAPSLRIQMGAASP